MERAFKIAGCKDPNDLQFAPGGTLWVLDQVDPNNVFPVHSEDGSIIEQIQTESIHGGGITYGNGALWLGSTKSLKTLKVNAKTGKTPKSCDTPGAGFYGKVTTPSGARGLKWVDGEYWMAVPASGRLFLMEPETGQIVSIPAPGNRSHGLAWDNGILWCVNSGRSRHLQAGSGRRKGYGQDSVNEGRSGTAWSRYG